METSKVGPPQSLKVVWRIENFSKLNKQKLSWRILVLNPRYTKTYQIHTHLQIYLCPVDHTNALFDYSLAITEQKDDLRTVKIREVKWGFDPSWKAYRHGLSLRLSKFHSPDHGYLLDDTCIVGVDGLFITLACFLCLICCVSFFALVSSFMAMIFIATCIALEFLQFLLYDFLVTKSLAPLPIKVIKIVANVEVLNVVLEKEHEMGWKNHKAVQENTQGKRQLKVSKIDDTAGSNQVDSPEVALVKHLGAGQIFQGMIHNSRASHLDAEDFEEIGGFSMALNPNIWYQSDPISPTHKSHASLYKQIWLKYGHIASSHVLTASSYLLQVMAVGDIMDSLLEMSHCGVVEVSSEKIGLWEGRIQTAENLQFNIEWLRKHFDGVKQGFDTMQKLKTTLQEEAQPIKVAKARVTAAEDELKKVQEELTMAKDELNEKISALASRAGPVTISESSSKCT
ncbi:hypothetical protein MKX03_007557 [Papaver bracteatum]|nr:hypothetical protein MKX03_007557 [Papaver bracteatum]